MNLFSRNVEAYKLDLKDDMSKEDQLTIPSTYYMGHAKDGGVRFLIKANNSCDFQELIFTKDQAKSLVEQFQFYMGEDDEN
jgi:hypothetical protein